MTNKFVKPLRPFDPRKNLIVNEKFRPKGSYSGADAFSGLQYDGYEDEGQSGDSGKEFSFFKTGGPILAGILKVDNNLNRTIILAANKSGEIYLLTPEQSSFKKLIKLKIPGSIIRTPKIADGIIYCTTREGMIFAINTGLDLWDSGKSKSKAGIIWKQKADKGILTEPIATGKILIVATLGSLIGFEAYYKDETTKSIGKKLWTANINGTVSTPRIHSGNIYIGTEDNNLLAFDYGGSKINNIWSYRSSGAIRSKPYVSLNEKFILVTTIDGFVYCLSRRNGEYKWNYVIKAPSYSSIVSTTIGNDEYYFFGADNGIFYCLNSVGKKEWIFKTNGKIRTEAVIHNGRVYFGSEDNNFYCLNIKTGKKIFRFSTDGNINSSPVIIDWIAYFGSTDSFVHGVYI